MCMCLYPKPLKSLMRPKLLKPALSQPPWFSEQIRQLPSTLRAWIINSSGPDRARKPLARSGPAPACPRHAAIGGITSPLMSVIQGEPYCCHFSTHKSTPHWHTCPKSYSFTQPEINYCRFSTQSYGDWLIDLTSVITNACYCVTVLKSFLWQQIDGSFAMTINPFVFLSAFNNDTISKNLWN